MTHRTAGDTARMPGAPTLTGEAPPAIDHKAVHQLVSKARRLYGARYDKAAVAEVTAGLAEHLTALVPACQSIINTLPADAPGLPRLTIAVDRAETELRVDPGKGVTAALVHMQLLADSACHLAAAVQQASRHERRTGRQEQQ